ncbi:MAG: DUF3417 domain-containing protein, partial [Victivallaceae bacterium]
PTAWVARMRESMARLTPQFSTNRTVRDYTKQHYLPAAAAYRKRIANNGSAGRSIVNWENTLKEKWSTLRFGDVKVETRGDQHVFEVQVYLNGLDPKTVRVELYADDVMGNAPVRQEMKHSRAVDHSGARHYSAAVSASRPQTDYTARIIPHCEGVAIPLENAQILWQR